MSWTWRWWLFLLAWPLFTFGCMFVRGMLNAGNVARYGPSADYRADPAGAFVATVIAGALYSVVLTAVVGLLL
jgi:hypothetical protein